MDYDNDNDEIRKLTIEELIQALNDGRVTDEQVADLPGVLGAGARRKLKAIDDRWTWPVHEVFIDVLAKGLANVPWPPEQSRVAANMGCDPKTLQGHIRHHIGPRTWKAFLAYLMRHSLTARPSIN